jgi:hypothetical protein
VGVQGCEVPRILVPENVSISLENMGASASHNPVVLHGLLHRKLYRFLSYHFQNPMTAVESCFHDQGRTCCPVASVDLVSCCSMRAGTRLVANDNLDTAGFGSKTVELVNISAAGNDPLHAQGQTVQVQ